MSFVEVITHEPLSIDESIQLATHEQRIEELLHQMTTAGTFIGEHLRQINENRLYRGIARTFEEYVQARWKRGRQWAYQLIDAAKTLTVLADPDVSNCLQIPESHLRPLTPLRDDPDLLRDAWERANEIAEERGENRTARHVTEAVRELDPHPVPIAEEPLTPYEQQIAARHQPEPTPEPTRHAVHFSSATPEWYTPASIIALARAAMSGIDLDPASSATAQQTVQAAHWFGLDHPDPGCRDGLAREWPGRVWMNPPYGDEIAAWVERLRHQVDMEIATEAIALLPARTDTAWFQPLLAQTICFVRGRVRFSGSDNSAPFPSVLVYFGDRPERFAQVFQALTYRIVKG